MFIESENNKIICITNIIPRLGKQGNTRYGLCPYVARNLILKLEQIFMKLKL